MNDGFNLSAWALRHRALVFYAMAVVTVLGVISYLGLARSEDPPFTFKVMVVQAWWPGASARQMQEEVADRIARKLQETPDVDYLRSYSRPGETQLFFNVRDSAGDLQVAGAWYQVRKKVTDIARDLPPGLVGPFFNDEFGDVYTNLYALESDGFPMAQMHDEAERIRDELLRVPGVAKVDLLGDQAQRIFIEPDNARLARLGISPAELAAAIGRQNAMAPAGAYTSGPDRIFVRPGGAFTDVESIRGTTLRIGGHSLRLATSPGCAAATRTPPPPWCACTASRFSPSA